jgi:Zinc carboxypeptidase
VTPALAALACAVAMAADVPERMKTRAEATNFEETSRAADVDRVLSALAEASPAVTVTSFGRSEEGRQLPLAILSSSAVADPAAARRSGKPRVLVLANIHAGEVEGKEAALIVARRLAVGDLRPLLPRMIVLVAPLYNADGNERISVDHRSAQFGPLTGVGIREHASGLDLNRDFIKLEAPESRALVKLLTEWDPQVVIDLHTTDGSYYGYRLTYAPTLAVGADPRLVTFVRGTLLESASHVMIDRGWRTYYYGNFTTEGQLDREQDRPPGAGGGAAAWRTFDARPRFVTNGIGLRNRISVLSEAYSYLPFERRVRVTEAFVETLLGQVARRGPAIQRLLADIDRDTAMAGARGTLGPLGSSGRLAPLEGAVPILVGDVESRINPRSGRQMTVMKETVVHEQLMQDYGFFEPVDPRLAPRAYIIPADGTAAADKVAALLTLHGIRTERLTEASTPMVEVTTAGTVERAVRELQGHFETHLRDVRRERRPVSIPAGSVRVPMDQPLARLAFHLLEPTSDDGVVTWNLLDEWLAAGKDVPIYRLVPGEPTNAGTRRPPGRSK